MYKKFWFIVPIILIIAVGALVLARGFSGEDDWICVNNQWVKHGNPYLTVPTSGCGATTSIVTTTAPTVELPPESKNFRSLNIAPGQKISSPLEITGEAKGTWFFEASFPVFLVNWDGLIIAQGVAQAKDNWMTEDFVPFEVELKFIKPDYKDNGALIFKKDNPSGLSQNDAAYEMPILFE